MLNRGSSLGGVLGAFWVLVSLLEVAIPPAQAQNAAPAAAPVKLGIVAARKEAKAVEIKVTLPTFEQCAETYIREHWSTWSKKHRNQWPSSLKRYAYPTIGNSPSRRSSPATSTNCFGRSGLRSERRPIVSADGSKRSSQKISTLTTPIFEILLSSPNSCARSFQGGRNASCVIILRCPKPRRRSSWRTYPQPAAPRLRCFVF